jgi:hypothetical protein
VIENFKNLPDNVHMLLFNLADSKNAAVYVAEYVANNFDKIDKDLLGVNMQQSHEIRMVSCNV